MVLFSFCRIGFFVFNLKMFPGITVSQFITILKGGLTFDISAVVYVNMLFILLHIIPLEIRYKNVYQTVLEYIFYITNGIAIALNGMDFVYYRFVNKRATADVFKTFEHDSNNTKVFFRFLVDYWPATLFTFFIWFLMVYFYKKVKVEKTGNINKIGYYSVNILMIPLAIALVIGAARGGYKH